MEHFIKGIAVLAGILIVNLIINVVCHMNGIDINSTMQSTVSAVCALLIYHGWIKK